MGVLTEDMQRVVQEQRLGFMATVCPDGSPNLSPKGTIRVWDDDHLVFADICSPDTMRNLQHNPAIEINVVDVLLRKGYRFKGTATTVTEGQLFDDIMDLFTGNGQSGQSGVSSLIRAWVLVKVSQARPLISPGYLPGVTESQTREQWESHYVSLPKPVSR